MDAGCKCLIPASLRLTTLTCPSWGFHMVKRSCERESAVTPCILSWLSILLYLQPRKVISLSGLKNFVIKRIYCILISPCQTKFEEGIMQELVGQVVCCKPLKLWVKELLQFSCDSNESWYTWWPWGVDVQDMFFKFVRQDIAMVTKFLQKLCGMNFFHSFHAIQVKVGTHDDLEV